MIKIYYIGPHLGNIYMIFKRVDYVYVGRVLAHPARSVINYRAIVNIHIDSEFPDFEFRWEEV